MKEYTEPVDLLGNATNPIFNVCPRNPPSVETEPRHGARVLCVIVGCLSLLCCRRNSGPNN